MKNKKFFLEILIKWNRNKNKRQMPWKGEKDPYKIWISEIILQQTRVQQGLDYYNRFIKTWPDVKKLAGANEQAVYKLWEGLGYYSRCKNLIASAKYISDELNGIFPNKYEEIIKLKGIGTYTAAAIASFAFGQPYAVLDGNVFRVLSRFFGIKIPIDSNEGKKLFSGLANELIDKKNPAEYNQALMDFGAVICKPAQPLCNDCLFQKRCIAYKNELVNILPVKEKNIKKRQRFFNYLVIEKDNKFFVKQRKEKDIWHNLFEFVLIEADALIPAKEFLKSAEFISLLCEQGFTCTKISEVYSQKLTHQTIAGRFFHISLNMPESSLYNYMQVSKEELALLPFPKFITSYLRD
ncbi:MAG: A/G-specific adenine glycosylase [Bacteroidota bacterium]|nr:A/G-specific adenine glycosylase [Bacteroidota bacterium]